MHRKEKKTGEGEEKQQKKEAGAVRESSQTPRTAHSWALRSASQESKFRSE